MEIAQLRYLATNVETEPKVKKEAWNDLLTVSYVFTSNR